MNKYLERLYNGVIKENPTFILILGMCPTLAVTTSVSNAFGMGVSTMIVLIMSNLLISLLGKVIPDKVRIPAYIVIIASLVTIVELLMAAYARPLSKSLGLYIPLIVVNCIILGRAEAYAAKNKPLLAVFDGIGMGVGFTLALSLIGLFRELIGAGTILGFQVMPASYQPIAIFTKAPGAFIVLGTLIAILNACKVKNNSSKKVEGCDGDCCHCTSSCPTPEKKKEEVQ